VLVVLSATSLAECKHDEPWVPQVVVGVESQPDHCQVKAVEMPCSAVVGYLQSTLSLSKHAPIQVSCVPVTSASCDLNGAYGLLQSAGYDNILGVIEVHTK
jgi:hypothetical protein